MMIPIPFPQVNSSYNTPTLEESIIPFKTTKMVIWAILPAFSIQNLEKFLSSKEKVYIIRHASPDWTRDDIPYHLPPGPPLVEQGLEEARTLGSFLKQAGVSLLLSSPLERCQRTAEIASQEAHASLQIVPELTEVQPGEDYENMRQRLLPVFERAAEESRQNGAVALVTHGEPTAVLLRALGMSAERLEKQRVFDHGNPLPPSGAWLAVRYESQPGWNLRIAYLPSSAPSPKEKTHR
jgi:broad specificity phosphatase PhoE